MKKLKRIAEKWNALNNDMERWEYLLSHKKEIALELDNDNTGCRFQENMLPNDSDNYDPPYLKNFDDWIGNSEGLYILFPILGIEANGV